MHRSTTLTASLTFENGNPPRTSHTGAQALLALEPISGPHRRPIPFSIPLGPDSCRQRLTGHDSAFYHVTFST
ncbi:hypothetical protein ASPBRDRAFT_194155 [Aspergillus brasiliensis CBS 101740]|uniref:Uncharacterized protein n=1 Tax=Aspergillus brasiliensis (strain CBS 101740 / IMI 381727 / IBT 21946) TaxID=767769 RepID=A0A1L9UNB1_ASPBC|nr:hypothetical protein ASPBRDRAFT_194155 [Aspergillus brasiliensis CBS 101740]